MTNICSERRLRSYRITMDGHAGFDMNGNDIVCHGISMLGFTLMQALIEAEADGIIKHLSQQIDDAHMEAVFTPVHRGKADTIVNTILCGFKLLGNQYPDYCKVIEMVDLGGEIDI